MDSRPPIKPIRLKTKRKGPSEADVESDTSDYAKTRGVASEKFTSPGRRNVPDRLFSGDNNAHWFIEFKAPGKEASGEQLRDHARRKAMGHHVFVVDNLELGKFVTDLMIECLVNANEN